MNSMATCSEFLRNGELNARNTFALKNDGLKRNQFGGTIGGPIVRNKLFFFGGHQTTTERAAPSTARQFIPSAKMLAGDFSDFAAPACNGGRQLNLAFPYVNNQINPALFSPAAVTLVNWNKDGLVFPRTNHPCGEIQFGRKSENNEHLSRRQNRLPGQRQTVVLRPLPGSATVGAERSGSLKLPDPQHRRPHTGRLFIGSRSDLPDRIGHGKFFPRHRAQDQSR